MPDTLILDEYVVVIDVSLNRDFMPVAPPDGRPLSAGVTLREVYQQALDYSIDDPTAFVVNGGAMWAVSLDPLSHIYHPNNEQPYSGWAGPKWGPGISVDVVMMFQDESGNVQRIIAREVNIDSSS